MSVMLSLFLDISIALLLPLLLLVHSSMSILDVFSILFVVFLILLMWSRRFLTWAFAGGKQIPDRDVSSFVLEMLTLIELVLMVTSSINKPRKRNEQND